MIHESIDHIPCCQIHADNFNGSDDSSQLVLIQAFPCEHGEVFIVAVVSIPVGYLLASREVSTVLIVAGNDLEVRISAKRSDLPGKGRTLELKQGVKRACARELSTVVKDGPFIGRSE
jgi:hypothetical protein